MHARTHLLVNLLNASVDADIKRPSRRKSARAEHAIRTRHGFAGIAENRKIDPHRLRELAVGLRTIDAGAEIRHVEVTQHVTARADRFALRPPPAGLTLWEPRNP